MHHTHKIVVYMFLGFIWTHYSTSISTQACENSIFKQRATSAETQGPGSSAYKYPFQNPSLPWKERVDDLADRLTLDELVNQTTARYGRAIPGIDRLDIRPTQYITECLHGVRKENATAFPQALGLAASFRSVLQSCTFNK